MTKEQESLVVNNIGLAYDVLSKHYFRVKNVLEYDDALQICFEGLIQAALTFDNTRSVAFSTYAYTVIKRHLFRQPILEARKREGAFITSMSSLDDLLQDEENSVVDFIPSDYDLEDECMASTEISLLYQYINELNEPYKSIMLLRCKDKIFKDISLSLGISESFVQQYYKKALNILRNKFIGGKHE